MRRRAKRISIAIFGGVLLLFGIIAIPYPGPGWLIVFASLAILATEFSWAENALHASRSKYDAWEAWIKKQSLFIRSLTFVGTAMVVVVTLWLLNTYGLINDLFNLNQDWLRSPFIKK